MSLVDTILFVLLILIALSGWFIIGGGLFQLFKVPAPKLRDGKNNVDAMTAMLVIWPIVLVVYWIVILFSVIRVNR